ncbi:Serine carboxypeptidase-like 19 [Zea mays]|uniref:Serine carboxypeptidase-like 19 n=1 Tax=Zea mays TaxID=4577 RepID=A0A1D6GTH1_MAIZE|nr:Serine carboxypeptidase-like 19 [Zea mays]
MAITPRLAAIFFSLLCCRSASSLRPPNLISNSSGGVITHLPGFQGPLPFHLQTGYVEVDEDNGVHLFYYFVRSEREDSPGDDPVVLWLTGGPGCSVLTGLAYEIGPLSFDLNGYVGGLPKLVYKQDSWTKWFDKYPQFFSSPLYIAGDSYSGMIVPTVTSEIARGKEEGSQPNLNLKGYLVGNPVTDFNFDGPSRIPFAHGMGLISDEIYECIKGISPNHVLEPLCAFASPKPKLISSGAREMLQLPVPVHTEEEEEELRLSEISLQCRTAGYMMSSMWANDASVRQALGIHKGTVPSWSRCNYDIPYTNDIPSAVKYHLDVTTKGYRSLVYNGDHDMVVPFIGTQAWIRSLNFSTVDEWRPWFVDGQVAGFTRSYSNNLTFATVKGGGHTAPEYMPRQCFAMFVRWVSGDPL